MYCIASKLTKYHLFAFSAFFKIILEAIRTRKNRIKIRREKILNYLVLVPEKKNISKASFVSVFYKLSDCTACFIAGNWCWHVLNPCARCSSGWFRVVALQAQVRHAITNFRILKKTITTSRIDKKIDRAKETYQTKENSPRKSPK